MIVINNYDGHDRTLIFSSFSLPNEMLLKFNWQSQLGKSMQIVESLKSDSYSQLGKLTRLGDLDS